MGKIYWSITARKCLQEIADYIAIDSPFYAVTFVERILEQADKLGKFPEIGRVVPEFKNDCLRELLFQNYRIVYRIKEDQIFIVAVSHASMDIISRAKRNNWDTK